MQNMNSLIRTKLFLPYTRHGLVHRSRLKEKLIQGLQGPLTLVTAPAGFGKTTLIAALIKDCELPIAWYSLEKSDNQPETFLRYFIAALQTVTDRVGNEAMQWLNGTQQVSPRMIFTSLINDLISVDFPVILVLDDYQFLSNKDIHEGMAFVLAHCPHTLHLVIASRSDPPLPIAQLRARAQVVELRASELSFSNEETAQFLNEVMGLQLESGAVEAIRARTEGWVAGLQLAALSMRDTKDLDRAIHDFSGTNRYILDYLLEEVLANLTPEVQQFLLSTSIIDHLTAPLCDALLGVGKEGNPEQPGAGRSISMLAYLEQANIFLVPLDAERQWYRYHHLFADLLQTRLKMACSREEINLLHTRAARWFEKNGYAYEAIHHASLIPDDQWVEELIEQNYMEMFQRKDSASIWAWTGSLSNEVILKSPKLSIHEAMSLSWGGQLGEAGRLLQEAEKNLRNKAPTPETKALLGHLAYVKSRVVGMQGDFHQAIELCLSARENTPPDNAALQGGIGVMLGYAYFLAGDFESAQKVLADTIQAGMDSGAINTTVGAYCVLARLEALQGKLLQSLQTIQAAERFVTERGSQHRGALSIIYVAYADTYHQWNELEKAHAAISKALQLIHFWGKADDIALAYVRHAFIQQARGNHSAAIEAIQRGEQIIQTSGVFYESRDAVETAKIRLSLIEHDPAEIQKWTTRYEKILDSSDPTLFKNEINFLTLARLYMAQNRLQEAENLLTKSGEHCRSEGRFGKFIEVLILRALAAQQRGSMAQALRLLEESLVLAEPEQFIRAYLDEGAPMLDLLNDWLHNTRADHLKAFGNCLCSQFDLVMPVEKVDKAVLANQNLPEPLSQRELEVLRLIALGKTNPEIAQALVVARGTVKAHAASIYRKLNVTNRTEAVARAQQSGILQ